MAKAKSAKPRITKTTTTRTSLIFTGDEVEFILGEEFRRRTGSLLPVALQWDIDNDELHQGRIITLEISAERTEHEDVNPED